MHHVSDREGRGGGRGAEEGGGGWGRDSRSKIIISFEKLKHG